jgi:hypothetical protein
VVNFKRGVGNGKDKSRNFRSYRNGRTAVYPTLGGPPLV